MSFISLILKKTFASSPGNPYFFTIGIEPEAFELSGVRLSKDVLFLNTLKTRCS